MSSDNWHHGHETSGSAARWAQGLFVFGALSLVVFLRSTPQFHTLAITFVSIVLEALPFVLLGTLIGGFIEVFVPREKISAWLPKRRWVAVCMAAGLGIIFPVCECAIVPVIRKLLQKGVPLSAAVAFLLGGPIVNPLVAASTAVAYFFDWSIVAYRLIFGYLVAVGVGLFMDLIFNHRCAVLAEAYSGCTDSDSLDTQAPGNPAHFKEKILQAAGHAAGDFFDIGRFFIIGAFIAGIAQTLVPRQAFVAVAGTPLLSIPVMMVLAMLLNLCSEADAFIAASFRSTSLSISAQLAFMVLGPMLDIKLLLMYQNLFRKHVIAVLAGLVFAMVFLAMVVFELFIGS